MSEGNVKFKKCFLTIISCLEVTFAFQIVTSARIFSSVDDDWQEEHARLAELDERVRDGVHGAGDASSVDLPLAGSNAHSSALPQPSSSSRLYPDIDERGGGDLAESLTRLILGSDPAIAGVGTARSDRSHLPPMLSGQPPRSSALAEQSLLLLSYQQQRMHRGPAPLPQVCVIMSLSY